MIIYSPPLFEDVDNIDVWFREIELCKCVNELDDKQQGPAIYLLLPCSVCQMESLYKGYSFFHRSAKISIVDYSNDFGRLYDQIRHYDMELPIGVLAYRVLKNANIKKNSN